MKTHQISIKVEKEVLDGIKVKAQKEARSVSNYCLQILNEVGRDND